MMRSPALERELRRRVRAEVRRSPVLEKEHRRNRSLRRPVDLSAFFSSLFLPAIFIAPVLLAGRVHSALLAVTLAALAGAIVRANHLLGDLHESTELLALLHLPIRDEDYARRQWRKALRSSLWMIPILTVSFAIAAGSVRPSGQAWAAGAAIGLLAWAATLSAAALLALRPRLATRLAPFSLGGYGLAAVILFASKHAEAWLSTLSTGWLLLLPPAGWTTAALRGALLKAEGAWLLLLAPAALLALALPFLARRIIRGFEVGDIVTGPAVNAETAIEYALDQHMAVQSEYDPELVESPELKPVRREELRRSIPAMMEERVRTRDFLEPVIWAPLGLLERIFGRLLDPRQSILAELLLQRPPSWTKRWKIALAVTLAGIGASFVPGVAPGLLFLFPIAAAMTAAPLLGGAWPGIKWTTASGWVIPVFGVHPVDPRELLPVLWKGNALRWAAWLPLLLAGASVLPPEAREIAIRASFAVLLVQPMLFALRLQTEPPGGTQITLFGLAMVPLYLSVAGAAAILLLSSQPLAGLALLAILPWILWRLTARHWNRHRVDLLGVVQAS